jgi:hypothetical protein
MSNIYSTQWLYSPDTRIVWDLFIVLIKVLEINAIKKRVLEAGTWTSKIPEPFAHKKTPN